MKPCPPLVIAQSNFTGSKKSFTLCLPKGTQSHVLHIIPRHLSHAEMDWVQFHEHAPILPIDSILSMDRMLGSCQTASGSPPHHHHYHHPAPLHIQLQVTKCRIAAGKVLLYWKFNFNQQNPKLQMSQTC